MFIVLSHAIDQLWLDQSRFLIRFHCIVDVLIATLQECPLNGTPLWSGLLRIFCSIMVMQTFPWEKKREKKKHLKLIAWTDIKHMHRVIQSGDERAMNTQTQFHSDKTKGWYANSFIYLAPDLFILWTACKSSLEKWTL